MITITIKGLSKEAHLALKQRAATHGRSLNTEAIAVLESSVRSTPVDSGAAIQRDRVPGGHNRSRFGDAGSRHQIGVWLDVGPLFVGSSSGPARAGPANSQPAIPATVRSGCAPSPKPDFIALFSRPSSVTGGR